MATLSGPGLVVGVAVIEALEDCGVAECGLKWPNDILVAERKLAGILVELGGEFLGPCHAVIGIGINLRLSAAAQARIDQPAMDLASLLRGTPPPRNRLAARLIARLLAALDRFATQGFAPFRETYARHDLLHGRAVQVLVAGETRPGIAAGVDERGSLLVRHGKSLTRYDSAEV